MLKIAWKDIYAHVLPANHRFPMEKYTLLPEQLLYEGTISESNFFTPELLSEAAIVRTHNADYWEKLKNLSLSRKEERKTGFPLSAALVERERVIMHGSVMAARFAVENGIAMNMAGGTHHSFTDRGEGFCLLNDIAIAAHDLLDNGLAKQILVVDLDVHQGNGTAQIFENEPKIFTFSMHGAANYPLHKEKSDLDVGLKDGTDDNTYLSLLDANLKALMDTVQPDFVFFQSGVDVLATDKLGRLGMTLQGCKQRDRIVLETCKQNDIPIMACMGGGYSEKVAHIVEAHANTFRLAQEIFF
ncbi:acetoin utilization deacetylase AcuC-like enzyme [Roseivirga ehrenbergii]|uniref:Deacetylase n=1 Tax=Roseivirga ehrenbergii (strain DSM 102268 / JCM 13514 / KCTC 12282 / NCIMB 14502 / KMM 6017) TaxID=279360 RepID=A0A150X6V0_ROSEK|nr:histone deacetylase [Roseivirga ehrenbergii]KYG74465.1 deacetylase [Roseivirga ehrenbergii]TCL14229.1 acetoin utilization deacetylase AcuC-like enzyme [Roseivirga ehrenbergii]